MSDTEGIAPIFLFSVLIETFMVSAVSVGLFSAIHAEYLQFMFSVGLILVFIFFSSIFFSSGSVTLL